MSGRSAFDYQLVADREDPVTFLNIRQRPAQADTEQGEKDQEDKTKIEAREASAFWRHCLTDPVGRREIHKLLERTKAFEVAPFAAAPNGSISDPATFYKMGQMSIGQALYQWFAIVAREELFKLQDEYNVHGGLGMRPDRQV